MVDPHSGVGFDLLIEFDGAGACVALVWPLPSHYPTLRTIRLLPLSSRQVLVVDDASGDDTLDVE